MYEINHVSAAGPWHTCIGSWALVPSRQQPVTDRFLDIPELVDVPELDSIRRVACQMAHRPNGGANPGCRLQAFAVLNIVQLLCSKLAHVSLPRHTVVAFRSLPKIRSPLELVLEAERTGGQDGQETTDH
ncbi:hypothetical protein CGRA01v4_06190 [Colletotrichum graminicola]|nr:hypothetical protein CGRA01v4_06190 [Colletotrichum graminicola]